ncbi:uncharacterized protein (DUF885 family) [Sphingomonas sp. PP-F2F-A104-K0414]|uniref:DUF885 domain-containing protein n=1 Tax=Sphingomonas sp. PP-F2F-A104-K0414 TaxID=2135661 RepID=UPI0010D24E8B|nr:DUF885 domain-containing protein [Sphingomonas sp. PP-F2F-A104-K0414]TCQ00800.1 uncharacterized protein (DUF885 family) [Sphingomonas sp. PP-F2F-A104-K0414]
MSIKLLLAAFLATTGASAAVGQALPPPTAQAGDSAEDTRLKALFYASDEASLKRNPVSAIFRGDLRYADHLGDYLTDAFTAAERAAAEADLAALGRIDRAKLSAVDQIAYDVFETNTRITLRGYAPDLLKIQRDLPMDHFSGFQTFYPDFASGQGAAPFKTLVDYENNLKRNAEYAAVLDRAIGLFREGMKDGIVQPRLVVDNMIGQFDNLIKEGVERSTFAGPLKTFPASVSAADQARLRTAYATQIRDVILPAEQRMRDFLANEYRAKARDSVGLSAIPGGAKLYAYLIEQNTTLPLSADAVHSLGLSEVARLLKDMETQKRAVGFKGTLPEFFTYLRTDAKFAPASAEKLREGYQAIETKIYKRIPEQFSLVPKTKLEIRAVPAFKEKTEAGGSYQGGTPDGTRPGVFYYNTYDLPSRYTWEMETLFLHEGVPGHHFQISLAQENTALPAFMRFGGNTAYVEGWALYSESLWKELGVETDPYQRMGGLNDEMLRAMRLVVDSGIHAKGWTRDQAIAYMLANSPMARTDATAEVERYIAIPGQALAYKIGQLTIARTKAKAKAALGAKFDPRGFHAQVLDTGALPMPVLEKKIDRWIAAGSATR